MRKKYILQHDERDCGAACLAMIAAHYHLYLPISRCRELTKTDKIGTNIYGIVNAAETIGLKANAMSGDQAELCSGIESGEVTFPFIAHIISDSSMLHYIVVYGMKNDKLSVADPASGKLNIPVDRFFSEWTGYIITFEKTSQFQQGNQTKGQFLKFFQLLKGQWRNLLGVIIASLFVASIGIIGAFVFQFVIDDFAFDQGYVDEHEHESEHTHADTSETHEQEVEEANITNNNNNSKFDIIMQRIIDYFSARFDLIFISLICLYILHALIQLIRGWLIIKIYRTVDIRLTLQYYNHIVDIPVSSLSVRQTGEYLSRFSDSAAIRQAISGATLTLLLDTIMAIAGSVILFLESKQLFFVSLMMIVFYACLVIVFKKPVEKSNRSVMENDAKLQSYFKESIDGMESVKASNAGDIVKTVSTNKYYQYLNELVKRSHISILQDTLAGTVELIGTALILWIGFSMVLSGQLTIGTLITFYALISYFTEPIKNLIELQPTVQSAFVAADRLNDIIDLETEQEIEQKRIIEKNNDTISVPSEIDKWEAKHIDFRYGNRELTLHDANLTIYKGERIAIVGESGSGKTTLAKLFLRFYEPEKGEVSINGNNICAFSLNSLRKSVAYVSEKPFFFTDTILNNLSFGVDSITEEDLDSICEICNIKDFIQSLPLGYNTPLDENGANISGGQRQRLALAHAIARHPQLLILDEATSNLDTVTENAIRDTIFNLDKNMSIIIIAHRLSTIKSCDRIYVMKDGSVSESGTFESLLALKGEFYRLWNAM